MAERATLKEKYGDPVKRLANLLSNLSPEIVETLVEYGEDGLLYVRRD